MEDGSFFLHLYIDYPQLLSKKLVVNYYSPIEQIHLLLNVIAATKKPSQPGLAIVVIG